MFIFWANQMWVERSRGSDGDDVLRYAPWLIWNLTNTHRFNNKTQFGSFKMMFCCDWSIWCKLLDMKGNNRFQINISIWSGSTLCDMNREPTRWRAVNCPSHLVYLCEQWCVCRERWGVDLADVPLTPLMMEATWPGVSHTVCCLIIPDSVWRRGGQRL